VTAWHGYARPPATVLPPAGASYSNSTNAAHNKGGRLCRPLFAAHSPRTQPARRPCRAGSLRAAARHYPVVRHVVRRLRGAFHVALALYVVVDQLVAVAISCVPSYCPSRLLVPVSAPCFEARRHRQAVAGRVCFIHYLLVGA